MKRRAVAIEAILKADDQLHDSVGADNWTRRRRNPSSAVGNPRSVGRKQRQQRLLVSRFYGLRELSEKPRFIGVCGVKPWGVASHPLSRTMDDLATSRFGLSECGCHLVVAAIEYFMQQKRSTLFGPETLQQHQKRDRQIRCQIELAIGWRR